MSSSNVQNLEEGTQESIRALIQAIAPEIASNSSGNLTSEEVASRLNDKLAELIGAENVPDIRNERGELVSEEGLPIVELSELVDPTDHRTSVSRPTPVTVEPLIPLASLSEEARTRLRVKRNHVLDLLEEEEKQEEISQKRREVEERDAMIRRKKDEVAKDMERMKEVREMQKRMGRALLFNVSKSREKERQEKEAQQLRDEEVDKDRKRSPAIKKKTVAFAECTEHINIPADVDSANVDWGDDVTPGRLMRTKRPTLLSQALLDRHPMKLNVVERQPAGQANSAALSQSTEGVDSDDGSDLQLGSDSTDSEEEPTLETDKVDFDTAQHQREVVLEYYTKRNTIGREAAQNMVDDPHDIESNVGVAQQPSKPVVSHFQAHRLASAYNASAMPSSSETGSISPGTTVLPASSVRRIQRSIRTGKLDSNGNLMGGEADSASDDEREQLEEVLELIRRGEIHNIGPNAGYSNTVLPSVNQENPSRFLQTKTPASLKEVASSFQAKTLPPPSMLSKTSKFKVSREAAGKPSSSMSIALGCSAPVLEVQSSSMTPISSSPATLPVTQTIIERSASNFPAAARSSTSHSPNPTRAGSATVGQILSDSSMADSSSHPPDGSRYTSSMPSSIIESPSFPQSQSSRRPDHPPTVLSTAAVKPENSYQLPPASPTPMPGEIPFREVDQNHSQPNLSLTVMSTVVRESKPNQHQILQAEFTQEPKLPKKISRFRAERTS